MHSHTRTQAPFAGMGWNSANIALTILLTLLFLIFLLLFMTLTAPPSQAQTSVPPTARQAATTPQFAAPLAHRTAIAESASASQVPADQSRASYRDPMHARAYRPGRGPLDNNWVYDNGPINGNNDAWPINY